MGSAWRDRRWSDGAGPVAVKAGREATRAANLRLVLQHLYDGQPLSRADLARATELTPATISTLVAELDADGLVSVAGPRRDTAQVGKPPTMLEIEPDARHTIAVDLSDPTTLRAAVVDLGGGVVRRLHAPTGGAKGEAAIDRVNALVADALGAATSPILGIGVGTPGVVVADGTVVEASSYDWHHVPLQAELEAATGHRVVVANDANLCAMAELAQSEHPSPSLAVVRIGSGVGAGLVIDGVPLVGTHAGAGEIGHLVVDPDGRRCRCGHDGCLETFVAAPRIEAAITEGADPAEVRRAAAERLGIALAAVVAILDLDQILLAGSQELLGDDFCSIATASLRERCLDSVAETVTVEFTTLGEEIVLAGAGALVLRQELGVV